MRHVGALALIGLMTLSFGCGDDGYSAAESPSVDAVALPQAGAGAFERVAAFGDNPGALNMYRYVPPRPRANAPLLVAMHACSQNAPTYRAAGWEPIADEFGFYVLYPEQNGANNGAGCFNWAGEYGDPTNLRRGQGENRSIISMIEHMQAEYDIDPNQIFATGHSGGAAQTALMLATWPDVFAGGAMIAGIPYNCTTQFNQVSTCLSPGLPRDARVWGQSVLDAFPDFDGRYPKVSVWQGNADFVVNATNGAEMVKQWTWVHGMDTQPDVVEQVDGHTRNRYVDARGEAMVEYYVINGGGHGTFVDPDRGCGSPGAFFVDNNICSSRRIAEFFGLTGEAPPVVDPPVDEPPVDDPPADEPPVDEPPVDEPPVEALTARIASPADGDVVWGQVEVLAEVSDPGAQVTFTINGLPVAVVVAPPYRYDWNTLLGVIGDKVIGVEAITPDGRRAVDSVQVRVGLGGPAIPPGEDPVDGGPEVPEVIGCVAVPGSTDLPGAWLLMLVPLLGLRRRS